MCLKSVYYCGLTASYMEVVELSELAISISSSDLRKPNCCFGNKYLHLILHSGKISVHPRVLPTSGEVGVWDGTNHHKAQQQKKCFLCLSLVFFSQPSPSTAPWEELTLTRAE